MCACVSVSVSVCLSVCVRAHARDRGSAGERLNRLSPPHPPKKRHGHDGINMCRLVAAAGGAAGQDAGGAGIAEKIAQRQRMRLSGQAISSPGPAARGEPASQDVVDGGTRHQDGAQVPAVPARRTRGGAGYQVGVRVLSPRPLAQIATGDDGGGEEGDEGGGGVASDGRKPGADAAAHAAPQPVPPTPPLVPPRRR